MNLHCSEMPTSTTCSAWLAHLSMNSIKTLDISIICNVMCGMFGWHLLPSSASIHTRKMSQGKGIRATSKWHRSSLLCDMWMWRPRSLIRVSHVRWLVLEVSWKRLQNGYGPNNNNNNNNNNSNNNNSNNNDNKDFIYRGCTVEHAQFSLWASVSNAII